MLALSTDALLAVDPPDRPGRLLALGPDGLALGRGGAGRDALSVALARGRVPVAAVAVPPFPRLGSPDRREQREAVVRAAGELDRANRLECSHVVIDLGMLDAPVFDDLTAKWDELVDAFGRGGAIDPLRREFLRMRTRVRDRHLDAVRRSLDALLDVAMRRGCSLGLLPAPVGRSLGMWDEIQSLCSEFAGGPLGPWRATDREHHLAILGLWGAATPAAMGADVADAAGLLGGLPPGSADLDFTAALDGLGETATLVIVSARANEVELRRAVDVVRRAAGAADR